MRSRVKMPGRKSTAVERIYLRGVYRDKYDYLSRNPEAVAAIAATTAALAAGQRTSSATPMPPTPFKGAGMITNGGRKIRSAYPVVKLKPTAEQTPFRD